MNRNLRCLLFSLVAALALQTAANANHIVGGELRIAPLGYANVYQITLIQFWDQNNLVIPTNTTAGNRDETAEIYIFRKKDNALMDKVVIDYKSTELIQYQNQACATLRSLNTSIGYYRGNVTLNPQTYNDAAGYYIVWERCCRNDDINNIVDPGENGMAFYMEIPPVNMINSSPAFNAPNGQYICSKRDFSMNMSATDADGDELRYSLVTPMRGHTSPNNLSGDGTPKSNYPLVTWASGISVANMIPGSKPLSITADGVLKVNASSIGLYVFTVQCDEYRGGVKIGSVRRDFQLLVIDCNDDQPELASIMLASKPVESVSFCPGRTVELETEVSADWSYQWQFNGLNIPGAVNPTIMVQDTGLYSVVKSFKQKCSRDTTSSSVKALYDNPIPAVITMDRDTICDGESVSLVANGGITGDLLVSWSKDGALLSIEESVLDVNDTGSYSLLLTNDISGCTGADTVNIVKETIEVSLPERVGVQRGFQTNLTPVLIPASSSYTYAWSPPEGLYSPATQMIATVGPEQETVYHLTVTSANGCVADTSTIVYVVDRLHIPTAFSPNKDGINDTFEIYNADNQIVEVRIYNRWGEIVFQSIGYSAPWDGSYKGKQVPAGVYPYIISTETAKVKGNVTLLK